MRIDLHTHSTASDGTDSPAGVMTAAAAAGLDVVALTDHDTMSGIARASAALPAGLTLVPGTELSCASPDGRGGQCTVHLLAYLHDPDSPGLHEEQRRLRDQRRVRLHRMATTMAADGFPVDPDTLLAEVDPASSAGRPHLARALVRASVVTSVGEAFARYLGDGRPYYLGRVDTPVDRAIEMITSAGGVTVLAHGFARKRGTTVTAGVITELAEIGLGGLEVDHPEHDPDDRAALRALAGELRLPVTGASDYHGTNKIVRLGQELTEPDMFDALIARANGASVIHG